MSARGHTRTLLYDGVLSYACRVSRLAELHAQCDELRRLIVAPPDDDAVRELYCELVDRFRDDPEALAIIQPIGEEIRRLEAAGALPSTLVARSERRKRT
jgi:hypothetical protein